MQYSMWQVDSFSRERFKGNPCGIVFEADSLTDDQMQTIARQLNLSETVFLCQPTNEDADYLARIFTPRNELPFAGHPTIAAAFSFYSAGATKGDRVGKALTQECGIGLVSIAVEVVDDAELFTLKMGEPIIASTEIGTDEVAQMLSIAPLAVSSDPVEVCSVGLPWLIARVNTLRDLESASPNLSLIESICRENQATGFSVYAEDAVMDECAVHVRSFVPAEGIPEDPVCGSGNGAVALHRSAHSMRGVEAFSYKAEQGLEVGRRGVLHLKVTENSARAPQIYLGGHAAKVIEGTIFV